jgi:SAM-dependent methyltransferase
MESNSEFPAIWYDITTKDHFWAYWRFKVLQKLLFKLNLDPSAKLLCLDIGAGQGIVINQLEISTNWVLDANDTNPTFKNSSKNRGQYYHFNIHDKPADFKQKYDLILILDVLEHIKDDKGFLDSAIFYLKPGGNLIINVPAIQLIYSKYDNLVGHIRRYNKKQLRNCIKDLNVTELNTVYWGMSLLPLLVFRKFILKFFIRPEKIFRIGVNSLGNTINSLLKVIANLEIRLY